MSVVILIAGVLGLAVAGYGLVTLSIDAARRRQYLDIVLAVVIAVVVVAALLFWGDTLLR